MELVQEGFKETEVGLIPEDWNIVRLGDKIKLKNGFALQSNFFSERGPIVMTPGNFKLEGGLKFDDGNTIRFAGEVSKEMCFDNGDLVMVMTDLTPNCNLLGKSGIIDSREVILHNQRIGKILIKSSGVDKNFLNCYFNSYLFSNRMKSTATGSTVRHTSVPTINNTQLILPTLQEQQAIAKAFSDVDALISSLDALIAKKKAIKQGAMQQLLTPPHKGGKRLDGFDGEWVETNLGALCTIFGRIGFRGYTVNDIVKEGQGAITLSPSNIVNGQLRLSKVTYLSWFKYEESPEIKIYNNDILLVKTGSTFGKTALVRGLERKATLNPQVVVLKKVKCNNVFLGYIMGFPLIQNQINSIVVGGAIPTLSQEQVSRFKLFVPPTIEEQKAIAQILSDMDTELEQLEAKKAKYQQIKQGMMQELLTGKTRLV